MEDTEIESLGKREERSDYTLYTLYIQCLKRVLMINHESVYRRTFRLPCHHLPRGFRVSSTHLHHQPQPLLKWKLRPPSIRRDSIAKERRLTGYYHWLNVWKCTGVRTCDLVCSSIINENVFCNSWHTDNIKRTSPNSVRWWMVGRRLRFAERRAMIWTIPFASLTQVFSYRLNDLTDFITQRTWSLIAVIGAIM